MLFCEISEIFKNTLSYGKPLAAASDIMNPSWLWLLKVLSKNRKQKIYKKGQKYFKKLISQNFVISFFVFAKIGSDAPD